MIPDEITKILLLLLLVSKIFLEKCVIVQNRNNIVKALVITLRKFIAKDIFSTFPKARKEKIRPNNK